MDISTNTNLQELKALAYDELVKKDLADRNLVAINERIGQIISQPANEESKEK